MADLTDMGYDPESGLTLRHRHFCDLYITYSTATVTQAQAARKAYLEAGYAAQSIQQATTHALELLTQRDIKEWVNVKVSQRLDAISVRADAVLLELALQATAEISYYRVNQTTGEVEVKPGVPLEYLKVVASNESESTTRVFERSNGDIERVTTWKPRFKLYDKQKALLILCQHLGLTDPELPPLEVMLNRLPPHVARIVKELLKKPAGYRPTPKVTNQTAEPTPTAP